MENYYELLEVDKNATKKEIKKAYYKLAKKYHPDVNPNNKVNQEIFKKINNAYEILMDDYTRKKYDEELNFKFNNEASNYSEYNGSETVYNEENYNKFNLGSFIKFTTISLIKLIFYIIAYPVVKLILFPISLFFKGIVFILVNTLRIALVISFIIDIAFIGFSIYGIVYMKDFKGILLLIFFIMVSGILIWIILFSDVVTEKLEDLSSDFVDFCLDF